MSGGVGCRRGLAPALLWLWCRLAAAALIRPLAWEPPYAAKTDKQTKPVRQSGAGSTGSKLLPGVAGSGVWAPEGASSLGQRGNSEGFWERRAWRTQVTGVIQWGGQLSPTLDILTEKYSISAFQTLSPLFPPWPLGKGSFWPVSPARRRLGSQPPGFPSLC